MSFGTLTSSRRRIGGITEWDSVVAMMLPSGRCMGRGRDNISVAAGMKSALRGSLSGAFVFWCVIGVSGARVIQ
jgi:hypothetical protein